MTASNPVHGSVVKAFHFRRRLRLLNDFHDLLGVSGVLSCCDEFAERGPSRIVFFFFFFS